MAITLRVRGEAQGLAERVMGRVTRTPVAAERRADYLLAIDAPENLGLLGDAEGYASVLLSDALRHNNPADIGVPLVVTPPLDHLKDGYIATVEPRTGFVHTRYRPDSNYNVIFATERCNSNCLMCSQPPKDDDDSYRIAENLRLLSLIEEPPQFMCISGGEATLLGDGLLSILQDLKSRFPNTLVQMLTNGRRYAEHAYCRQVAAVGHPHLVSAVPLYADVADVHDYIVQAEGAFDETIEGLYNAAEAGLTLEIRVVLHKQSIPRLPQLAEYIYRNFPFVSHVALMGLENMGYVKKNWETLWIDPVDYMGALEKAALSLQRQGMLVSLYNLQLCLLPRSLWGFARKSISDFKNVYVEECEGCAAREHCAGLFLSQENRHSKHIRRIQAI